MGRRQRINLKLWNRRIQSHVAGQHHRYCLTVHYKLFDKLYQLKKGVSGQLTKVKNFVKMWFGVLVCVILPIAVYVVDIIITTKVIESKGYKHAMVHWQDDTNKNNKPIPKMNTFGFDDYTLKETWFFEVCWIVFFLDKYLSLY